MIEKVKILRQDDLPMPLIYLASPEDLGKWYAGQLAWSLDHGEVELAVSCFDTAPMGFPTSRGAYAVLKALTDFLYDHPQVRSLTIRCAGEETAQVYQLLWNMWYAEHKPPHSHEEERQ